MSHICELHHKLMEARGEDTRKWEEDMRKKNAIVEPPPPSSTDI